MSVPSIIGHHTANSMTRGDSYIVRHNNSDPSLILGD
jgi:hypothetical protein